MSDQICRSGTGQKAVFQQSQEIRAGEKPSTADWGFGWAIWGILVKQDSGFRQKAPAALTPSERLKFEPRRARQKIIH